METLKGNIEKALKEDLEGFDFIKAICDGISIETAEGRLANTLFNTLNNWQDTRSTLFCKVAEAQRSAQQMVDNMTDNFYGATYYTSFTPNPNNEIKTIAEKLAMHEEKITSFLWIIGISKNDAVEIFEKLTAIRK